MTNEEQILLETFRYRLRDLINQYNKLKSEFESYKEQAKLDLEEKNKEIDDLKENIKRLETRYTNLKTARSLTEDDEKPEFARKRLNEIVREIDKCIALLNS